MLSRVRFDVQEPPAGHFNSNALSWNNNDAFIPSARVDDFIKGEESRKHNVCLFRKKTTEDPNMTRGHKIIRYWCSYGPKDFRGKTPPAAQSHTDSKPPPKGKGSRPAAQRISMGMSCQRGCQCHFAIVTFRDKPGFSLIRWANREHIDKDGKPCHGLLDPTAKEVNAHMAHKLSKSCLDFVRNLLLNGVKPSQIILQHRKHLEEIAKSNGESLDPVLSRDLQLRVRDVLNVQAIMKSKGQIMASYDPNSVNEDRDEDAGSKGRKLRLNKQPRKRPFSQLDPNQKCTTSNHDFVSLDLNDNREKPKNGTFVSMGSSRTNVGQSSDPYTAAFQMERAPPMEAAVLMDKDQDMQAHFPMDSVAEVQSPLLAERVPEMLAHLQTDNISEMEARLVMERIPEVQATLQMDKISAMQASFEMDGAREMEASLQLDRVPELQAPLQTDKIPEMQASLQVGRVPERQGPLHMDRVPGTRVPFQMERTPLIRGTPQMESATIVQDLEGYSIDLMQSLAQKNPALISSEQLYALRYGLGASVTGLN